MTMQLQLEKATWRLVNLYLKISAIWQCVSYETSASKLFPVSLSIHMFRRSMISDQLTS